MGIALLLFFLFSLFFRFFFFSLTHSSLNLLSKPVCDFVSYLDEEEGEGKRGKNAEEDSKKGEREKERAERREDRVALRVGTGKGKNKAEEIDDVTTFDVKCAMSIPLAITCNKSVSLSLSLFLSLSLSFSFLSYFLPSFFLDGTLSEKVFVYGCCDDFYLNWRGKSIVLSASAYPRIQSCDDFLRKNGSDLGEHPYPLIFIDSAALRMSADVSTCQIIERLRRQGALPALCALSPFSLLGLSLTSLAVCDDIAFSKDFRVVEYATLSRILDMFFMPLEETFLIGFLSLLSHLFTLSIFFFSFLMAYVCRQRRREGFLLIFPLLWDSHRRSGSSHTDQIL